MHFIERDAEGRIVRIEIVEFNKRIIFLLKYDKELKCLLMRN